VIFGSEWLVITLRSHTENVTRLATSWSNEQAYLNPGELNLAATRDQLIQAARIHDAAKPVKFGLYYESPYRKGVMKWGYTFAGHRFEVFNDDPYVQELARLHHTYATDDVVRAVARLRARGVPNAGNLPFDLYALEMCDQIEATLACVALEGDLETRTFMDFHIEAEDDNRFSLDPYPFSDDEISLEVEYATLSPPGKWVWQVETGKEKAREKALKELQAWLVGDEGLQTAPLKQEELMVCALI
jgi:hypothetical protein